MSKNNPVPRKLRKQFVAEVAPYDHDDAPDGAWFCMIEDAAREFLDRHNLHGDRNSAAHQYLRLAYPDERD